eukprot:m.26894 g.26894  ORF g.26894 m.26894 type:complete len:410 (+) comp11727_c0_seq1:219-1448(+)
MAELLLQSESVLRHSGIAITALGNRGFGLVAETAIAAGTPVLVERPLGSVIRPIDHYDTLDAITANIDVAEQLLLDNGAGAQLALSHLSPRTSDDMASALSAHQHEITTAARDLRRRQSSTSFTTVLKDEELQRLVAICMHNNFMPMHDAVSTHQSYGLWLVASFFNHSCQPNCVHYADINATEPTDASFTTLVLRAVRDIAQGEELTLAYVELATEYSVRQDLLLSHYGFACDCSHCESENGATQPHPVLDQDQVDRACHYAATTNKLGPVRALLIKGQQSKWSPTDCQRLELNDVLARCLHASGQSALAVKALQATIAAAQYHYPSNWPTLSSLYKRGHAYAKASGNEALADEFARLFNATRRVCRGSRCSNSDCKLFMTTEKMCVCCQPPKVFCSSACATSHTLPN